MVPASLTVATHFSPDMHRLLQEPQSLMLVRAPSAIAPLRGHLHLVLSPVPTHVPPLALQAAASQASRERPRRPIVGTRSGVEVSRGMPLRGCECGRRRGALLGQFTQSPRDNIIVYKIGYLEPVD